MHSPLPIETGSSVGAETRFVYWLLVYIHKRLQFFS